MVLRPDGSIVVTGYTYSQASSDDFLTIAYSPGGKPLWTNLYDGPAHSTDYASWICTGAGGEVWVTGSSLRTATNYDLTDVVLIKYSNNGIPLWTNRYSSAETNGDFPQALATDAAGNTYVVVSSAYWPSDGTGGTPVGGALIKYDASGIPLWTNQYPDYSDDGIYGPPAIALDPAGNILTSVGFNSPDYYGGSALIKLTTDGVPVWTNLSGGGSITVNHQGDIFLTGETYGPSFIGYVIEKISAAGISLWTNTMSGPTYDGGNVPQTLFDPSGNVFLVGGGSGSGFPGQYQILKVSTNGTPLWMKVNVNYFSNDWVLDAASVDNAGNLYLAGHGPYSTHTNADFVTVKFSGDGTALWTNRFDSVGLNDYPLAMAVDDAGNIYVAGQAHVLTAPPLVQSVPQLTVVKYADLMFYKPPQDFTGTDNITYTITDSLGNQATTNIPVLITPGQFQLSLTSPTNLTPAGLNFTLNTTPGTNTVIIETSADLINWLAIQTNSTVNGSVNLIAPPATNSPRRFYRAVIPGAITGP